MTGAIGGRSWTGRRAASPPDPGPDGRTSPLGRYGPSDGAPTDADRAITVHLLGAPVRVLAAAREHHDGLMREFRLLAMSGAMDREGAPVRLVDLTQELGVRYASARVRPDADFNRAVEQGLDTVDLAYSVPPAAVEGAGQLQALMDEADVFCRSGQLITLPRTPVVRRFGDWYLDQFARQVAGHAATRWDGPLDPR